MQANAYRTAGQLVVSTPGRVAQALETGLIQTTLLSKTLSMFVLDEADLLLLHEYECDLQAIAPQVIILVMLHSVHNARFQMSTHQFMSHTWDWHVILLLVTWRSIVRLLPQHDSHCQSSPEGTLRWNHHSVSMCQCEALIVVRPYKDKKCLLHAMECLQCIIPLQDAVNRDIIAISTPLAPDQCP